MKICQNTTLNEKIMKGVTIRKLLGLACVLLFIKLIWLIFIGPSTTDLKLDQMENIPDFGFKQSGCVFVNGECKEEDEQRITGKGLYTYRNTFYLDGQPFRIIGGSFHYFRTQPDQWMDRLLKMKAAGLNTVTTYIPWNVHEKIRLQYNFGGRYDLPSFIRQAQSVGLHVIIRAGPYICAEWDLGGLPAWLLSQPDIILRSSASKAYVTYVEQYFSKLLPILFPFTHKQGGPIIAFQIENEFGSLKMRDDTYMEFLIKQHKNYGLDELYLTSDGAQTLQYGQMPGVLATVNFAKNPAAALKSLQQFQPNKPLMVTEFWSGWFDHWTEKHHAFEAIETAERVHTILGEFNASINFYMFTGGTNFGFYNGANNLSQYEPTITSYDYDAAISETGDVTAKYLAIHNVIKSLKLGPSEWPQIPQNSKKASYGTVQLTQMLEYSEIAKISEKLYGKITRENPTFMELLQFNNGYGQNYGWCLYRTQFKKGTTLTLKADVRDRAQILINGKELAIHDWTSPTNIISITQSLLQENENILDILVENMGRVNYRRANDDTRMLEKQKKGLDGIIYIDDTLLSNWQHFPFDFDYQFHEMINGANMWQELDLEKEPVGSPKALRGVLHLMDNAIDTFIDMTGWDKGIVLINGFNLGRYWSVGPQQTLYVPAPLLHKGNNDIIIFDLKPYKHEVTFIDHPILG